MTFAQQTKDREFAVMTKLLSIFGVVEAKQMRELFSHLPEGQYGRIMAQMQREGLAYRTPDGRYLSTSRYSLHKAEKKDSIMCFWALIRVKNFLLDFCTGVSPAIMSFTSKSTDYDLIPATARTKEILKNEDLPPKELVRIFVAEAMSEVSDIPTRRENDYVIVVEKDGSAQLYGL